MAPTQQGFRLSASTGLHCGDRPYQQDQVAVLLHPYVRGCALGLVADGMGGKSGGRTAAEQVLMTARQVFEKFVPATDDPAELLRQLVVESHLMIQLTAVTSEEEPHSTLAAFLLLPSRACYVAHAGDSRVYHFRGAELVSRTIDHSYVQQLIDEGRISESQANSHPQAHLLTGCLGTSQLDPPISIARIPELNPGDTMLACSDGLWHYLPARDFGLLASALPARECAQALIEKARERSRGGGDNLSVVVMKVETLPE